jgi:ATP adenylyltransferase
MDYLWSPWRYQYIANIKNTRACVFCIGESVEHDEEKFILFRGKYNFVILNIFPYTTGHLLISPYQHLSDFSDCSPGQITEMMDLAGQGKLAIERSYHPDGFNLGMNLGKCAGAGVEHHLHFHVVPRWIGDANFMSIVGESRVLPEALDVTFQKLKGFFK